MIPHKDYIKEYERIKSEECDKNFKCVNSNSGICMWLKHGGCECSSECERYQKCFTCKAFGMCEKKIEFLLCEYFEKEKL